MTLYSKIRSLLSHKNKGRLTKLIYLFNIKPTHNRKNASTFKKGIVVFSADFEMAWAFRYSKTENMNADNLALRERENVPVLLELFEKHDIPITWATVGHLFLEKCNCENGNKHLEMNRPKYFENRNWLFQDGDWYDSDPCSNYKEDPAWYAPDLIDIILKSKVKHEIGCHTFSHIDCSYENCEKMLLDNELDRCVKEAKRKDIKLKSFVFPGGTFGNYESLIKHGFTSYRKPSKHNIDIPYIDKYGLISIPSSFGLDKDPYNWSVRFHKTIIRKYIKKTIRSKQVCHFWFHPSMNNWYLENVFPEILNLVYQHRKNGSIDVLTMQQVAERIKK